MGISDTSCMIDGLPLLYWHWNLGKSVQGSSEGILGLHNCAVADKGSIDEYYGDFP